MPSITTVFRNCFIPKDGSLRHSHVTVENTRVKQIEIVSDTDYGKLNFDVKFGEYGSIYDDSEPSKHEHEKNSVKFSVFECAGRILSPGFIDIQLNGAFGIDFSNPGIKKEDVLAVARKLTMHGVTHFCPTMVSSSKTTYKRVIPLIGDIALMDRSVNNPVNGRASLELGMHLEGPFFAASKRGAHEAGCIRESIDDSAVCNVYGKEIQDLHNEAGVSIITMAPELPGAGKVIEALSRSNVTISMGHTEAVLKDGINARKCGATLLTHLFNAMRPFHHREPGLLGLLQYSVNNENCRDLFYSIIADGLHSHPTSVKSAYALSKNTILVTDAMSAMGLGDGHHSLGSEAVTVKNNRAVIRGTDTLAGSVASMDSCVRSFKEFTGCSHYEALQAATANPAILLGKDHELGFVKPGSSANFVLLDNTLSVLRTVVSGCIVYSLDEKCQALKEHSQARTILPRKRKELN